MGPRDYKNPDNGNFYCSTKNYKFCNFIKCDILLYITPHLNNLCISIYNKI